MSEADAVMVERTRVVAWLRRYADEAEEIGGDPCYEDGLRNAADAIEKGEHEQ